MLAVRHLHMCLQLCIHVHMMPRHLRRAVAATRLQTAALGVQQVGDDFVVDLEEGAAAGDAQVLLLHELEEGRGGGGGAIFHFVRE